MTEGYDMDTYRRRDGPKFPRLYLVVCVFIMFTDRFPTVQNPTENVAVLGLLDRRRGEKDRKHPGIYRSECWIIFVIRSFFSMHI